MLNKLASAGCDIENARHRFLDDDEFLSESYRALAVDPEFAALDLALKEGRYDDAFLSAHNLKGVTLTLGASPLADTISRVVEDLRNGPTETLAEDYAAFRFEADRILPILRS